jgi:hypothetical protein
MHLPVIHFGEDQLKRRRRRVIHSGRRDGIMAVLALFNYLAVVSPKLDKGLPSQSQEGLDVPLPSNHPTLTLVFLQ